MMVVLAELDDVFLAAHTRTAYNFRPNTIDNDLRGATAYRDEVGGCLPCRPESLLHD